uniref:NADH dehydrogenase subunit 6 n=1 Tax=Prionopetalum kraepelini TaxID=2931675 RepID=A0A8T9JCF5_9MYRI|nr:NADH dehydrogenase subunit 6 [Prionopetalum kraepelini]UOF70472.1 NADH dehydrogenase subunit 6 [Prionopetalum kraepelini]
MILLTTILFLVSITFPLLYHPMMMGIMIIFMSLTISMFMWTTMQFSWMAYILFLIFLGALLVLFIYISSLAPNEQFMKLSPFTMSLIFLFPILMIPQSVKDCFINSVNFLPSVKIFNQYLMPFTIFMALFLFLTLIIISKITLFKQGPLRTTT